jgi:MYXO-CTERM domain-containing protein
VRAVKWALAAGAAVIGWASGAGAAPCTRPDLIETLPADGATDVPPNARLSARYAATAEYLGEPVPLEHVGVGIESAPATFSANEGFLTIAPDQPLAAGATYKITWPALRGLTTAALGTGGTVTFTAGSTDDTAAPEFSGIRSVAWDVERPNDDCSDSPQDRYRFDVALGDATDDASRDLLTLVVFQTAGPELSGGSPEPVLVERVPPSGQGAEVRRSIDAAVGHVCFAALVRDSLGRVSNSAQNEVCTTTVRPPFFYGCSVTRGPADRWPGWVGVFVLGAIVRWRRRRRGAE